jgi:hypothetical protein
LYYLKNYPTYDVLGYLLFGFSGGHAFDHLETLLPILQTSLARLKVMPERSVKTVEALDKLLEKTTCHHRLHGAGDPQATG